MSKKLGSPREPKDQAAKFAVLNSDVAEMMQKMRTRFPVSEDDEVSRG
jgi:hypothetical protein